MYHEITAKSILSAKNGMNIYRGCTHGCIYCDSRSRCYQMDHAFEDIAVKVNAPELLADTLRRKRRRCMIATGAMSDPYLPLEEKLRLTRRCLKVIADHGFGLSILTKSPRILQDLALLEQINRQAKCVVQMTLTTADEALCRQLEPLVAPTGERIEALKVLHDRQLPTIVWLGPLLPFINDTKENLAALLNGCRDAGVKGILCFGMGMTLREGNREYYYDRLDELFPGLKEKYIQTYGNAYQVNSPNSRTLMKMFRDTSAQYDIMSDSREIFHYLNTLETDTYEQLRLDL